jgi:uncharacterized protein
MHISSPCIRNCCLDEEDICVGCFRHVNEIMLWQNATYIKKQQILSLAAARKKQKLSWQNEHQQNELE